MSRAVFLDRDGVLNHALMRDGRTYAPLNLDEFQLEPEAGDAVRKVRDAGLEAIVVTNQPELSLGTLDTAVLESMHRQIRSSLGVRHFFVCPHTSDAGCRCHKPAPGLILDASSALGVDLAKSYMVGDRWRDVGAGKAAGCFTILIERDYSYRGSPDGFSDTPDLSVSSLSAAVDAILNIERTRRFR